ncbi:MAG: 3-dehydroquinate synthase family protein [Burkholderiales bacterium]
MSALFELDIHSSLKSYRVSIGSGLARAALEAEDAVVVVDAAMQAFFPWLEQARCISVEAREDAKNLQTVASVIERMRILGANRHSALLAIGGGIVQDVATFAASSYMRGIEWAYCPTTLLGMVDSCIGGKSSLNVGAYKNIVGNFYPPERVLIDTDFCSTLAPMQMTEGLCEAVKICYASRGPEFAQYLNMAAGAAMLSDTTRLSEMINLSLQTKKTFIEADEFDNGVRLLLNFGHTFGHAIEGASAYRISHGVAVGLGMLCAARLSESYDFVTPGQQRVRNLVTYVRSLLVPLTGLQQALEAMSPAEVLTCFRSDKKHGKGEFALIVFDQGGFLERRFVSATTDNEARIADVFEWVRKTLLYEIQ